MEGAARRRGRHADVWPHVTGGSSREDFNRPPGRTGGGGGQVDGGAGGGWRDGRVSDPADSGPFTVSVGATAT